ncbi:MAG: FG-GAP-like repeat-containing protein, partial [Bacteroidota bacterium]
ILLLLFLFSLIYLRAQISFSPQLIIDTTTNYNYCVYPCDIDGDEDNDVIAGSQNKIVWYENLDGFGTFGVPNVICDTMMQTWSVFACDIDSDGDFDILSATENDDKIAWYENTDGLGTFGAQQIITTIADGAWSVYACDIDGDNDMDVISASLEDSKIALYENTDGFGNFGPQQIISATILSARSVYACDIDGDNDMDVLCASVTDNEIAWFENLDGIGTFGTKQTITTLANDALCVYAADIDSDGDFDVLSASLADDKIAWYENTDGQGAFGVQQIITTIADGARRVYASDIDSDGDIDVLSASIGDSKIAWYENVDGNGTFGAQQIITTNVNGPWSVIACDIDNDGDNDVLTASVNDDKIAWYRNQHPCLIADYPFNGNANDVSGNGLHGDTTGHSPILVNDRFGNSNSAYEFDGVDDYILLPTIYNIFGSNPQEWSISFWYNMSEISPAKYYTFLSDYYSPGGNDTTFCTLFELSGPTGKMFTSIRYSNHTSTVYDVSEAQIGEWRYVVMTVSKIYEEMKVFEDGHFIGYDDVNSLYNYFADSLVNLFIGRRPAFWSALNYMKGKIDDIQLFNCALDSISIDSLYHIGGWDIDTCNNFSLMVNSIETACGLSNGSAEVLITGGNSPFIYNWSNGDTLSVADSLSAGMYSLQVTDSLGCYAHEEFIINSSGGPSVSLNGQTNNLCFGGNNGTIDINVTGGTAPYTYTWSNSATTQNISNLSAGNYQVMISDYNGCMASFSTTVTQPAQIQINFSVTNPACLANDGEILANVSGGSPGYSFLWSNSSSLNPITSLNAGMYSVTVTDLVGCTRTSGINLTSNGGPVINLDSIYNEGCGGTGGAIYVTVSGGSTPYASYSWSNSTFNEDLTGGAPGAYNLTVTDASGCIGVFSAEIISVQPLEQPICVVMVDSITHTNLIVWEKVQANGIDHYNIYRESWYLGQYDLVASVQYDSMSEFNDIAANPMIRSWRYKISSEDTCGNESPLSEDHKTIHLTVNQGLNQTYNLIWDHYEGFPYYTYYIYRHLNSAGWEMIDSLPANLTSYTDHPGSNGGLKYIVAINTSGQCVPTSSVKANGGPYSQSTSNMEDEGVIGEINDIDLSEISIYPNPNSGEFIIEIPSKNIITEISGYDITGSLIFSRKTKDTKVKVNMKDFSKGVYIFKVINNSTTGSFKIVIQ